MLGARGRDRPPRRHVNEDEQIGILPALEREDPLLDKVAGPEGLGVGADELVPRGLATLRACGQAGLPEDVDHRAA